MSIKIDGTKNKIYKDSGNSVYVEKDLYVDGQKVDPKGEVSTNYVTIGENGVKDLTIYGPNTVFQIRVTKYTDMSNVVKEDGYYDVTTNNDDINITDLEGYTHLFVNISDPNSGEEEPTDPENPEDIVVTFDGATKDTLNNKIIESTSYDGSINWNNQVKLGLTAFKIPWSCNTGGEGEGSGEVELLFRENNWGINEETGYPLSLEYTTTIETGYYYVTIKGSLSLDEANKKLKLWVSYSSQLIPEQPEVGLAFSYGVTSGTQATISQIVVEQASTLSLRQNVVEENSSVIRYENLIVNNDALIQGNLNVYGYINDLKWYWDYINFDAPVINLGAGFLAKLIDTNIVIDENTISIPTLQLSPGSVYTTDSYNVSWKSDGNMVIESSKTISNITGLIQVLRYE